MSSFFRKFTGTISSMRKHFCSKEKFPLSFDGEYDLTYVGHTRYDKEGDFSALYEVVINIKPFQNIFQDLFYISPFYHLVFPFDKFIVLDADTEFKKSPELLYEEFNKFEPEQLFGVAKDMSHNYRLLLIDHRCVDDIYLFFTFSRQNIYKGLTILTAFWATPASCRVLTPELS